MTAAAALFARRGFHGVSIDDIGSAAGMSGPGIYRHFPSKEAVLSQMLLDISERLLAEGGRRASAAADAHEALDALLRWHVSFALSQPDLITVQTRELANVPEPARRQIRRLQRLYVEEWVRPACVPPSTRFSACSTRLRTARASCPPRPWPNSCTPWPAPPSPRPRPEKIRGIRLCLADDHLSSLLSRVRHICRKADVIMVIS